MKNNKPFGLDIGTISMKAVWLMEENGKLALRTIAAAPIPAKGMLSESPFDQQEMAGSIRKLVDDAKITTQYVNLSLPESQVYIRVIEMPVLSDNELALAIYWESEQYIPVPLNTITLDWTVLKKPTENIPGSKMQVLLVGAPTAILNKYQKIATMAGLSINIMETEILSTIRPLIVGEQFPTSLIVHIGSLSTSFAIVQENTIVFTYSIATGGVALSRAIANDLNFTITQAEEYKNTYGISPHSQGGKIGKSTEPVLLSIVAEIKKATSFYTERYKNERAIAQILLSGSSAKVLGMDVFFAKNCGIETVVANPFVKLGIASAPKQVLDHAPEYTIAIGLAMRDYE